MALKKLNTALDALSETVGEFNVGAVSIQDFKPLEEQITDIRQLLKVQKSHSNLLNAKHKADSVTEKPEESIDTTISILNERIAQLRNINSSIILCLHSCSINDIFMKDRPTPEIKKQVQGCMRKLFVLNDKMISIHHSMIEAFNTEHELLINHPKSLDKYRKFLKEQEDFRDKNLQETNPQLSKNKKKVEAKLRKINIMKRLTRSMIAAADGMVLEKPFLYEMMKKHRDLVTIETIIEMARDKNLANPASTMSS